MTGTAVEITTNADQLAAALQKIADRFGSMEPAMKVIGNVVKSSMQENFETGGRPAGWVALKPATLKNKKSGNILVEQGMAGGLLGSISFKAESDVVYVGTHKVYGAIHHYGGMAGRGKKTKIEARPWAVVQDEDWQEIEELLGKYLFTGKTT